MAWLRPPLQVCQTSNAVKRLRQRARLTLSAPGSLLPTRRQKRPCGCAAEIVDNRAQRRTHPRPAIIATAGARPVTIQGGRWAGGDDRAIRSTCELSQKSLPFLVKNLRGFVAAAVIGFP
jgi:hypothetical protein